MKKYKFKEVFKERWKFYLAGYIFGYILSLIYYGAPNFLYLIPIKLTSIIFGLLIGTALYYIKQKVTVFNSAYRSLKYMLIALIIIFVFWMLQKILIVYGVDITPFIGYRE